MTTGASHCSRPAARAADRFFAPAPTPHTNGPKIHETLCQQQLRKRGTLLRHRPAPSPGLPAQDMAGMR